MFGGRIELPSVRFTTYCRRGYQTRLDYSQFAYFIYRQLPCGHVMHLATTVIQITASLIYICHVPATLQHTLRQKLNCFCQSLANLSPEFRCLSVLTVSTPSRRLQFFAEFRPVPLVLCLVCPPTTAVWVPLLARNTVCMRFRLPPMTIDCLADSQICRGICHLCPLITVAYVSRHWAASLSRMRFILRSVLNPPVDVGGESRSASLRSGSVQVDPITKLV